MNLVCTVVRGEMLRRLDDSLNTSDIDESLEMLRSRPLFEIAEAREGLANDREKRHAREHIFNNDGSRGWWADDALRETGAEREKIIRSAYIKALALRKSLIDDGRPDKKLRTLWVRGLSRVEVYVFELDSEIVVQWLTPDVPEDPENPAPPPADRTNPVMDERIWACATSARIDTYVKRFSDAKYDTENRVESELPGIGIFHVIGY